LVIWPERWTRALLIAELAEAGYDAVGASSMLAALRYAGHDPERGLVRAIILEDRALDPEGKALLSELENKHPAARRIIVTRAFGAPPRGSWDDVIRRPISIGDLVARIRTLLPQ
jgi:DNA-binding response OmpR family regulator